MFCVITWNERTPILKVIGELFFELWCTQIEKFCFEKNAFKNGVSLHSQPKVRFKEYFEYFLIRQKFWKNEPFGKCWEHWFYILIIPKSY